MALECIDSSNYVSKILSERRKAKKPLMEKMRRARINDSLNELKTLVLDLLNKDASRYSKMEKADILEMTVSYLRAAQRKDLRVQDMNSLAEFRAGFNQCAAEVSKNLSASDSSGHLREKLMSHLASNCHGNRVNSTFAPPSFPANNTTVWVPYPSPPPSPISQNTVYLAGTVPVLRDSSSLMSPVSPLQTTAQVKTEFVKRPVSTKKPALWRPW
ncbi:transcription factor HES-4-A-like [Actinia tenebrosa]|uniref:Transcription factor HES-4-A-like n=1 Tax=Actinia tenebrosa TaxID=6105 RepID=A0A6P8I0U6_ACTTE|nr:transcription factor HES-4-A-like [Actinia tenebrosa]